jgi:hypothetical protein
VVGDTGKERYSRIILQDENVLIEDPPDALNTQRRDCRAPAYSNQEPQYSSDAAG